MARNIYHEARGEPEAGQAAVAWVVMNRSKHPSYPGSLCGVVYDSNSNGCQFSWTCDGLSDDMNDRAAVREAVRIADAVMMGVIPDPTHGAIMYHTDGVHPYWTDSYEVAAVIDTHIFYEE